MSNQLNLPLFEIPRFLWTLLAVHVWYPYCKQVVLLFGENPLSFSVQPRFFLMFASPIILSRLECLFYCAMLHPLVLDRTVVCGCRCARVYTSQTSIMYPHICPAVSGRYM